MLVEATNKTTVSIMQRELSALRNRLDETPGRLFGIDLTIRIFALAQEVNDLCRHASCIDVHEAGPLLVRVRYDLDEMQILLGTH